MIESSVAMFESMSPIIAIYTPRSGSSRSIEVLIHYIGPELLAGVRGGSRPHLEILIKNDATTGISSHEIDTGGDKLTLPLRIGRISRIVRIVEILNQDRAHLLILAY